MDKVKAMKEFGASHVVELKFNEPLIALSVPDGQDIYPLDFARTACRSHDKLLAAVKAARGYLNDHDADCWCTALPHTSDCPYQKREEVLAKLDLALKECEG